MPDFKNLFLLPEQSEQFIDEAGLLPMPLPYQYEAKLSSTDIKSHKAKIFYAIKVPILSISKEKNMDDAEMKNRIMTNKR